MIHDRLENAGTYRGLSPAFGRALDWLGGQGKDGLARLPEGRIEIDGDSVYALVQAYETEPREKRMYETHRRYADIQVLVEGQEAIVYRQAGSAGCQTIMEVLSPYDEARDAATFRLSDGLDLVIHEGEFGIFFPQDAHAPKVAIPHPSRVRKVVVKVRV